MKIRNILLMGGNGEVGFSLAQKIDSKYKVFIFDKKKKYLKNSNIKFLFGNLFNKRNLNTITKNVDVIIYLIGKKGGPDSLHLKNYKEYFDTNCELIFNFLNENKFTKLKKIIFFSTEHVYGDKANIKNKLLKKEVYPKNYYGSTKLIAEKILLNFFKKNKVNVDILRIPRVIQNNKDFISNMINQAFKSKKIIINQSKASFYFLHIDDLIDAVNISINQINTKFRILNLVNNSKSVDLKYLAKNIKVLFSSPIDIKLKNIKNFKDHNPINHVISNIQAKEILKWHPKISTKMIIKKKYLYYENLYNS